MQLSRCYKYYYASNISYCVILFINSGIFVYPTTGDYDAVAQ